MKKVDKLNQEQIKKSNRLNILKALRENEQLMKRDIASLLGLSITTVTTNINVLKEEGLVLETGISKSTGGRKPVILKIDENARYGIGVDISPSEVNIIITNLLSEIVCETKFKYEQALEFEKTLEKVIEQINVLLEENGIDKTKCLGMGLSLPGIIDEENFTLYNAPNIGVRDYCFDQFQKELGMPLYLENEANIAAYAELVLGNAQDHDNVVYISVTEGIGCGIIIDGEIFKSSSKRAGEFGHMRISDQNVQCNCGRKGCWELFASKRALYRFYNEISHKECNDLDDFFGMIDKGDESAQMALEKYIDYLAVGIENILLALDPELIIIGGEIAKYESHVENQILKRMKLKSMISFSQDNRIISSGLSNKGSLIGSSLLPLRGVFV